MRCFLSIGLRRFTGLGCCFAHHGAGGRPGGCATGTQGIGGVLAVKLAAPLVGGGRRRQSATGSVVPLAEFAPNSATFGLCSLRSFGAELLTEGMAVVSQVAVVTGDTVTR